VPLICWLPLKQNLALIFRILPSGYILHLIAQVESSTFMSGVNDTTVQTFSFIKVKIQAFKASQNPALYGPFMGSCHLGLSEAFILAAKARGFHHSVS